MRLEEFEETVSAVLDDLPEDFSRHLDNVQVVVAERPSPEEMRQTGLRSGSTLLGLYQGVPRPSRGMGYMLVLPDKITIYREPIERTASRTGIAEKEMVRRVVLHEIAHHFGIPDARLRELGY